MTPAQLEYVKRRISELLQGMEMTPGQGRALAMHMARELVVRMRSKDDHSTDAFQYLTAMAEAKPRHTRPRIS